MIFNMDIPLQILKIDLKDIDTDDDTFQISTGVVSEELAYSVKQFGLISLPVLFQNSKQSEKKKPWKIVCGFKRVAACKKAGFTNIEARVVSGKDSPEINRNCLLLSIADNAVKRQLNPIEQSKAVVKLLQFSSNHHGKLLPSVKDICLSKQENLCSTLSDKDYYINKKSVFSELSKLLNISKNYSYFEKLITLSELPSKIHELILNDTITMTIALELSMFEKIIILLFADYFTKLKLSLNKQREFITMVQEISKRDNISVIDILNDKFLVDLRDNDKLDGNMRTGKIRLYLKKRRFPAISHAEDLFKEHLKKLKLGNNAKLVPPKNFEGTVYSLNLTFNNIKQIEEHKLLMERLCQNKSLSKILER